MRKVNRCDPFRFYSRGWREEEDRENFTNLSFSQRLFVKSRDRVK
jgi:hypothetical protein